MGTRSKEQKERVNDTHCCVCFKLRTAILLSICISIILTFSYGYEYWTNPKSRESDPTNFYGYVIIAGIEFVTNIIGWIAVYNHIRLITKIFTYWIIVNLLALGIIFFASDIFDYLHFAFFIAWICVQILILILLWKYKQVLKMVYGWGDDEEPEEEPEEIEAEPMTKPEPKPEVKKENGANVNVSINVNVPQQQQMQQQPMGMMYQQPMQPMMQPMMVQPQGQYPMQQQIQNGYPQQPIPMQQQQAPMGQVPNGHPNTSIPNNRSQPEALYAIQANPPNAPHSPVKQKQQQYTQQNAKLAKLSDVAQQADPPKEDSNSDTDPNGQVRISVYSNNGAAIAQMEPQEAKLNDEIYNTARWQNTNQPAMTNQMQLEPSEGDEGDMIQKGNTNDDLYSQGRGRQTNQGPPQAFIDNHNGRPRVKTPDPPPPPNVNRFESHASDNAVLEDDFIAEVQPNNHQGQTKGVNLYFLDPGDNGTKK